MKYWILTSEYPPEKSGGIGTYVKEHSEAFAIQGHQVFILHGNIGNPNTSKTISPQISLQQFSLDDHSGPYLGEEAALSYEFAERVLIRLSSETPDVIEVQEYLGIGYYLLLKKYTGEPLLQNIPIIVTAHAPSFLYLEYNHFPVYQFPEYWIGEMEKFSLLAADLVISPSQYLVESLKKRMTEAFPEKIVQLFNPYTPPASLVSGAIERNKLIVFGKLSISKGALHLLKEADILWKQGLDFKIEWIGGTDIYLHTEEQTIGHFVSRKYSEHINAGRLRLAGNVSYDRINTFLETAHAVIIPSIVDNLPYTAIETMAAGKVILASGSGGQAELVQDGINGFIFHWEHPSSFGNQLKRILALDNEALINIGQRATKRIQCCSPETYYAAKKEVITALCHQYKSSRSFPVIRPQKRTAVEPTKELQQGLSVVIPYYNMGAYIDDCLTAIYASTYPPAAVFIIDDGSYDQASIDKLSALQLSYPSLIIIRQQNAGLPAARNAGLQKVSSKYVIFLDADDSIDRHYFEKAIAVLEQYDNISFVTCWIQYFGAASGTWAAHNPEVPYLLFHNTVHSGSMFTTHDLLSIGGYDNGFTYGMEDYEIAVNLVSKGFHGACIPRTLYRYRIRKKSMSKSFTPAKQLYLYNLLSTKHAAIFSKYGAELANLLNANGPGYLHDNPTRSARQQAGSYWKNKAKKIIKKYPVLRKPALALANLLNK